MIYQTFDLSELDISSENTFNGVNVKISISRGMIVIDNRYVIVLASYKDQMQVHKLSVQIDFFEVDTNGLFVRNTNKTLRKKNYSDPYYSYFAQDWITQDFRKMGMCNNIGENELKTYLGEEAHFFFNKDTLGNNQKEWVPCVPPYVVYDVDSEKFILSNPESTEHEFRVIGTDAEGNPFEELMSLNGVIFEREKVLLEGVTEFYVKNMTVGNSSFPKKQTISIEE